MRRAFCLYVLIVVKYSYWMMIRFYLIFVSRVGEVGVALFITSILVCVLHLLFKNHGEFALKDDVLPVFIPKFIQSGRRGRGLIFMS